MDDEDDRHNFTDAADDLLSLHDQRLAAVVEVLLQHGASSVLDLGCGDGKLVRELLAEPQFTNILGIDVSAAVLAIASEKFRKHRGRVKFLLLSVTSRDRRLLGFDAAAAVEVIEHLDPAALAGFEQSIFAVARPGLVVVTTPNAEYNSQWQRLTAGQFRHADHEFEWSRGQFEDWARGLARMHGYRVAFQGIGPSHPDHGSPTQMAMFTRAAADSNGSSGSLG